MWLLCEEGPYAMVIVFAETADKHYQWFLAEIWLLYYQNLLPLLFLLMHYIDLSVEYFVIYSSQKWSTDTAFIAYTDMVAKDANAIYIVAHTAGHIDGSKARVSNGKGAWISKSSSSLDENNYSLFNQDDHHSLVESCHNAV